MTDTNQYYGVRVEGSDDLFFQVGKTLDGKPVGDQHLRLIVESIHRALSLGRADRVLDVGSGNGLVTRQLAKYCDSVIGIERSPELYSVALVHSASDNVAYHNSTVEDFDLSSLACTKAYMYEVMQHLNYADAHSLVRKIVDALEPKGKLFIGGVLDETRKWEFYNTSERRYAHFKALRDGHDPLGFWYHPDHLCALGNELGMKVEIRAQDEKLYTSHYRFDCVLEAL